MTSDTERAEAIVDNEMGLSEYAAARLAQIAAQYDADLRLQVAGKAANVIRIPDILALNAAPGVRVRVIARGPEAHSVLHAIRVLFLSAFEVNCTRPESVPSHRRCAA